MAKKDTQKQTVNEKAADKDEKDYVEAEYEIVDEDKDSADGAETAEEEIYQEAEEATSEGGQYELHGIPNYRTCNDEIRAVMDEHIAAIDPYDVRSIRQYGKKELGELAGVAESVRQRAERDDSMLQSVEDLGADLADVDWAGMAQQGTAVVSRGMRGTIDFVKKNPGTALATVAALPFAGPWAAAIPGLKIAHSKAQSLKNRNSAEQNLRRGIEKSAELENNIVLLLQKIDPVTDDLNELGRSQVNAYRQVSILVGAGLERLRRIDEEEMPELDAQLEADPTDMELRMRKDDLQTGRRMLALRVKDMHGSRVINEASMVMLSRLKNVFADAASKLETHLDVSVPLWRSLGQNAGIELFASKLADVSREADKHSAHILEASVQLNDQTTRRIHESVESGAVDIDEVSRTMERLSTSLRDNAKAIGMRRSDLMEDHKRLSDTSAKFNKVVVDYNEITKGRAPQLGNESGRQALEFKGGANDSQPAGKGKKRVDAPKDSAGGPQ